MEPIFLTVDQVLRIHADQVDRYGGSHGLRDRGAFESAVAQPESSFGSAYLHGDLFEMAAAYLFHLVQNHAFIDGNKRVGAVAADVFLTLNGIALQPTEEDYEALVMKVAQGQAEKPEIAEFLRAHSTPSG